MARLTIRQSFCNKIPTYSQFYIQLVCQKPKFLLPHFHQMSIFKKERNAVLALEDGSVFRGFAFGAECTVVGEGVFNTGMTGYQETLTDPSYFGQIVTMTSPQIGNYGTNLNDEESKGPKVAGFVVRDLSPVTSNWRSTDSLSDYLQKNGIPGIEGVDTRAITKKLRTAGSLKSCLSTEGISDEEAVKRAQQSESIVGQDYVKEVTCSESFVFDADGVVFMNTLCSYVFGPIGCIQNPK